MHALRSGPGFAMAVKRLARTFCGPAAFTAASAVGCHAIAAPGPGPTVTDVVEFTRIVYPEVGDVDRLQSHVSPDGKSAFIVTRRANTRTDRNRYEILLLDLRPERLAAGKVGTPVAVATLEPVRDNESGHPSVQDVQWRGPGTIVLRARLDDRRFQVYKVDTVSKRLTQLTFSPTEVVSFAISDDLRRVVYAAQQSNPPMASGRRSVVVGSQSFWSINRGQIDMLSQLRHYRYFVAESGSRSAARALGESFPEIGTRSPPVSVSPDGRWAILPRYVPARQQVWSEQYPLVAETVATYGPGASVDPLSYFARSGRYAPRQFVAHRLSDGLQRLVVDAPDDIHTFPTRPELLWQGGGKSLLVGGTHLPLDGAGGGSRGSHVIEYWPDADRWSVVAELQGRLGALLPHPSSLRSFVVTDTGGRRTFERQADGGWVASPRMDAKAPERSAASIAAGWTLRLRDGLDLPPDVVADGPAGQQVQLTRLNPRYSSAWGTIRPYAWKDTKGRDWNGGLMVPADHDPKVRYPLVIQTYGFDQKRFYLDGANRGIGYTSGFAGRAFLREGILVLALPIRATANAPTTEAGALVHFREGVRGAIDALVADGLVDKDRIGIMGWSMTGEHVLNQVAFSDAPIRAATLLDGDANTIFSLTVTYGYRDTMQARKAETNEGLPFGDTLPNWIRNDPALNTHCIKAAMRIETYGSSVRNNWDVYALLRRQYKAAEMVVIPDGTHGLMTPSERMISLQGNVDWFRYWLKGEQRSEAFLWGESDETLKEQYRRWNQMAELKRADDARPRCTPREAR